MGVPTSVSIGSMVNLPPTDRSEDYITRNCNYSFREKPRNHYIFARGVWGDVYASRRGVYSGPSAPCAHRLCKRLHAQSKAQKPKHLCLWCIGGCLRLLRERHGIPSAPCAHRDNQYSSLTPAKGTLLFNVWFDLLGMRISPSCRTLPGTL